VNFLDAKRNKKFVKVGSYFNRQRTRRMALYNIYVKKLFSLYTVVHGCRYKTAQITI